MKTVLRSILAMVLAVVSLVGTVPAAWAQAGTAVQASKERAACDGIQQDRAACLREAGAAQQEARRNGLTSEPENYQKNASARCQLQPPADRADCEARVRGTGNSSREGSVMGGGTIQETVTTVPVRTK